MKKIIISLLSAFSFNCFATTTTASFPITASVSAFCAFGTVTGLTFGNYSTSSAVTNSASYINITCTNTTPWTLALNSGTTSGGTITNRLLANGANTLPYNIYKDSGFSTVFGDGTTGANVTGTGTGGTQQTLVYGKIPAGYGPTPGSYSDSITISLSY